LRGRGETSRLTEACGSLRGSGRRDGSGPRLDSLDILVDRLDPLDVIAIPILPGRVLADVDLDVQRDAVQLLGILDLHYAGSVAVSGQGTVGDLHRGRVLVLEVEAVDNLASGVGSVNDLQGKLEVGPIPIPGGPHLALHNLGLVPACGKGGEGLLRRYSVRIKIKLGHGFRLLGFSE
jgi:hypothetical protein